MEKRWTEQFKGAALARIKEYESFLDACGITPVTGIEQELYVVTPNSHNPSIMQKESFAVEFANEDWSQSPFVEGIKLEVPSRHLYEIVVGRGSKTHERHDRKTGKKIIAGERVYPHPLLNASSIVRATNGVRKRMQKKAAIYVDPKAEVDFDGSHVHEPNTALQCNISLWNKESGEPLFRNYAPGEENYTSTNALTQSCADELLHAQKATAALTITSEHALERTKHELGTGVHQRTYGIRGTMKSLGQTISLRNSASSDEEAKTVLPSLYFENEMAGGGEEPALAMLVTLGRVVQGVKNYMADRQIKTPDAMKKYIAQGKLNEPVDFTFHDINATLPESLREAFFETEKSDLAKEIMGKDFHQAYCEAYKRKLFGNQEALIQR